MLEEHLSYWWQVSEIASGGDIPLIIVVYKDIFDSHWPTSNTCQLADVDTLSLNRFNVYRRTCMKGPIVHVWFGGLQRIMSFYM